MKAIFIVSLMLISSFAWTQSSVAQTGEAENAGNTALDAGTSQVTVPDTIMFTIDELNEIKDRISTGAIDTEQSNGPQSFDQPTLYLQSILYYGPDEWTIWVNGVPVGPKEEFQTFQVTDITPRYVQLLVPLSAQGMRPVRLEPNQTFITESGIIIEGKFN
ncbi:MAG: hypothetical protein KDE14_12910 [Rhodobacteraceae bacterium]|nr:hypothetical protein [Paracoccaceae bacterium]